MEEGGGGGKRRAWLQAVGGVVVLTVGPVGRHLWYDAALRQEASKGSQRVDLIVKRSVQQWEAEADEKENRTIDPRSGPG